MYYTCRMRPALRASAIEFLDNLLEKSLKPTVIPLLEEEETLSKAEISGDAVFRMLLGGEDPWLKTIATEIVLNETKNEYLIAG